MSLKAKEASRRNGILYGGRKPRPLHVARRDFWLRVKKGLPDQCWIWLGSKSEGYGYFYFGGRPWRTHRFSWYICIGAIPTGMLVCHSCDNPSCVNPTHLFLGTVADNNRDCRSKSRNYPPPRRVKKAVKSSLNYYE